MLYQKIALALESWNNCLKTGNIEWESRWAERLEKMSKQLPSGSGLDLGPRLDLDRSTPNRLVISHCDYHHMNDHGMYVRWTEHQVIVTPSLAHGFELRVTGRDRNQIKDYIHEVFDNTLRATADPAKAVA